MKLGNNDITLKLGSADVSAAYLGSTLVYSGGSQPTPPHDYSQDYLTFRAREDGTFSFSKTGASYSLDSGTTWTSIAANANTPTVQSGDTIMWRGNMTQTSVEGIGTFSSSGNFDVDGNIMSLVYGDGFIGQTIINDFQFRTLFNNCNKLISAENLVLPSTTLTTNCYFAMFASCSSLTTAPQLPATTLAEYCYNQMFYGCSSLTTPPMTLPATTLAQSCCYLMFYHCTSLASAPQLLATTLSDRCYQSMFAGCTSLSAITCLATDISAERCTMNWLYNVSSSGTFTKAESMNDWQSGGDGIPSSWTVVDYSS